MTIDEKQLHFYIQHYQQKYRYQHLCRIVSASAFLVGVVMGVVINQVIYADRQPLHSLDPSLTRSLIDPSDFDWSAL